MGRLSARIIEDARRFRGEASELPSTRPNQGWITFACRFRNRTTANLFKSVTRPFATMSTIHRPIPDGSAVVYVTLFKSDW